MLRRYVVVLVVCLCSPLSTTVAGSPPNAKSIILMVKDVPRGKGDQAWGIEASGSHGGTTWENKFQRDPTNTYSDGAGSTVEAFVYPTVSLRAVKSLYNGMTGTWNWTPAGIGDADEGARRKVDHLWHYYLRFRRGVVYVTLDVAGRIVKPAIVANMARLMDHRIECLSKS